MSPTSETSDPRDELFDVVDAADCVIDRQPRHVVHARGLRHRAVHVLLFDRRGRVFVQRRAWTKDCAPGCWDTSAAGHVGSGESYACAARRELEEELGLRLEDPLTPLFRIDACADTGHEFIWVYSVISDQPVSPDPGEIIDGRWCTRPEVEAWLAREAGAFTRSFRILWQRLHSE